MSEFKRKKGSSESYRRNNPTVNNPSMTVNYGRHLMNRIHDISRKMGFMTASEFIRYSVRKELDKQAELLYMPHIKEYSDD